MTPPLVPVVALAGPSGSGKSTLARALQEGRGGVLQLSCDAWYRDRSSLPRAAREALDYDDPAAIEWPLLVEQLDRLRAGEAVRTPRYDFATHTRRGDPEPPRRAGRLLVLEGILALHRPEIRERLALAVYVEAPREVCLARRIERDVHERGRDEEEVRRRFEEMVWPVAERCVLPCRDLADLVLDGTAPVAAGLARLRAALGPILTAPPGPLPARGPA